MADEGGSKTAIIYALLLRRMRLSRNAAGKRTEEQVPADNIVVIFLAQGLDFDFNLRRLERELVMVRRNGADLRYSGEYRRFI